MRRSALVSAGGVAVLAFGAGLALAAPGSAAAQTADCASLSGAGLFASTTITDAKVVPADPAKGLPAYCEVTGVIRPVAGSNIGVVYRLPEGWNGKMLGLGGGGWAGNVTLPAAAGGLKAHYATAQTDAGHPSTSVWETAWASNPEAVTDFAYRAMHLMTETGKQVVARYYGRPQSKAYYQGCSTGGRQGLMEVQRFPDDYDAAIVGAPVYNLIVQTSAVVRNEIFSSPGAALTNEILAKVNAHVLQACDAQDGDKDGLITDPRACGWDPAEMQCKPGESGADCLTPGQVKALRQAYAGVKTRGGRVAAWPLARGGETGWSRFISTGKPDPTGGGGLGGLRGPIMGEPDFDLSKFDPDRDLSKIRGGAFAKAYEANDPDIRAFTRRGGKLLMWHGWSDPGPSPIGTITYFREADGKLGAGQTSARLFLLPGVEHCGGGPGPSQVDLLGALDQWVQTGRAPATLIATKSSPPLTRPICAFPTTARYGGAGDLDDPKNFQCR